MRTPTTPTVAAYLALAALAWAGRDDEADGDPQAAARPRRQPRA